MASKSVKSKGSRVKIRLPSPESYYLDRLFDPEELYYTPMNELLKRYKKRNLRAGRVFNLAKKYGNVPESREREIIMPKMERAGQRIFGNENFYYPPPKVYFCSKPLDPSSVKRSTQRKSSDTDEDSDVDSEFDFDDEIKTDYTWVRDRRKLRQDLTALDLSIDYLKRKKDLNDMEKRVLYKMRFADKEIQTNEIVENNAIRTKSSHGPKIKYPVPTALEKIEEFLRENRWRLVDLFASLDKNKDWRVKKADFVRECEREKLVLSGSLIDELVMALSGDSKADYINYKRLARGRSSHLVERRSQLYDSAEALEQDQFIPLELQQEKKMSREKTLSSFSNLSSVRDLKSRMSSGKSVDKHITKSITIMETQQAKKSNALSAESVRSDPKYLQLPKIDTQPGRYPLDVAERCTSYTSTITNKTNSASQMSAIKAKRDKDMSYAIKKTKKELRDKDQATHDACIEKCQSKNIYSAVLMDNLHKGLLLPDDRDRDEIVGEMREKVEKKKQLKLAKKKEMLLKEKKEKMQQLINR